VRITTGLGAAANYFSYEISIGRVRASRGKTCDWSDCRNVTNWILLMETIFTFCFHSIIFYGNITWLRNYG